MPSEGPAQTRAWWPLGSPAGPVVGGVPRAAAGPPAPAGHRLREMAYGPVMRRHAARFGPVELKILANTWSRPEYWVWIESGATYGHDQHAITIEKNVSTFFALWTPHTACTGSDHVMPGHFHANLIWPLEIKPRRGEWGEWPRVYVALTPSERGGGADTQPVRRPGRNFYCKGLGRWNFFLELAGC